MSDTVIYNLVIGVFAAAFLTMGLWKSRAATSLSGYVANNRNTGWPLLFASLVATEVGGGFAVGLVALGYQLGLAAVLMGIAYALGYVYVVALAPRMRQVMTEAEDVSYVRAVELRYGSPVADLISAVMVLAYWCLLAAQVLGGAVFMQTFNGLPIEYGVVAAGAVLIVYTALGGLRGVFITDAFQLLVMALVSLCVLFPPLFADPTVSTRLWQLPAEYFGKLSASSTIFLVGAVVFLGPANFMRLDIWQRVGAARDDSAAKWAFRFAIPAILLFAALYPVVGMAVRAIGYTGDPQLAAPEYVTRVLQTRAFRAITLASVVAALMSTADSILNMCAIVLSQRVGARHLWRQWWALPKGSAGQDNVGQQLVTRLRWLAAVVGVSAIALALVFRNVVELIVGATTGFLIFSPVVLGVLLGWPGGRWRGLLSVGGGLVVLVVCMAAGFSQEGFLPALLLSWAGYWLGAHFDGKAASRPGPAAVAKPQPSPTDDETAMRV